MKTLIEIKAELDVVVQDIQAIIDTPVALSSNPVVEVDVKEADGTVETFVPEVVA